MISRAMNSTRLRLRIRTPLPVPPHTPSRATNHTPKLPFTTPKYYSSTSRSLPKIAQPSLWASVLPKFLRHRTSTSPSSSTSTSAPKEWNPASFYIIIFILIGSQAIRMIALKNEYTAFTRSTDAKIRLLREVIEKVKSGEQVDVEKLLGSRDEGKEREWDEVLREIEREDSLWHQKQKESVKGDVETQGQELKQEQEPTQTQSKDPVLPANAESANNNEATDNRTKRRVNFF